MDTHPELSTSGYTFHETLGTDWIGASLDSFSAELAAEAASAGASLFLATPERDATSGKLHNSIFAYDGERGCVGAHRKINTLKVGSEAWSSPGTAATVVTVAGDEGPM